MKIKTLLNRQKLASLLLILLFLPISEAWSKARTKTPPGTKLETSMDFSDSNIRGRYDYGGEAMAKIENEKPMIQLIDVPTDFKDRLKKQALQSQAGDSK